MNPRAHAIAAASRCFNLAGDFTGIFVDCPKHWSTICSLISINQHVLCNHHRYQSTGTCIADFIHVGARTFKNFCITLRCLTGWNFKCFLTGIHIVRSNSAVRRLPNGNSRRMSWRPSRGTRYPVGIESRCSSSGIREQQVRLFTRN